MATAASNAPTVPMTRSGPSLDVVRALVGGIFCIVFATFQQPRPLSDAWGEALLLLCPLSIIPLTLVILQKGAPAAAWGVWKRIEQYELSAATVLIGSYLMAPALPTSVLTLPWFVLTLLIGWAGVLGLTRRQYRDTTTVTVDLGCVLIAVGGFWTVVERTGVELWGFSGVIALLTAVHFHYAGFLLLLATGWAARESGSSATARAACFAVILGVPLTALGILAGQAKWHPGVEAAAAALMAGAGWLVAWLHLRLGARTDAHRTVRILWTIGGGALFVSMAMALLYALRELLRVPGLDIPLMRAVHGTLNAFGFGLCGIAGWRLHRSGQVRGEAE